MLFPSIIVLLVFYNAEAFPRLFPFNDGEQSGPLVHTHLGYIRGLKAEDRNYSMFMGIPYAEVNYDNVFGGSYAGDTEGVPDPLQTLEDVTATTSSIVIAIPPPEALSKVNLQQNVSKKLDFLEGALINPEEPLSSQVTGHQSVAFEWAEPAVPYPKFDTVFEAFDDSAICPQVEEFNHTIVGTLDCLHLNIYVPDSASADNKLPVFVWIFGGGFSLGFAGRFLYGPSFLVRHDIIFVTLNYRLGPYGFMCLDTPEVPGNQGLRDQLLALRWIKGNIAAFGGDDTKITIGGNSAGGISVDFLLHYGKDEDLFHKIIPQSGSILVTGSIGESNPTIPLILAQFFNHTSNDLNDALSFLANVDSDKMIAAVNELGVIFAPCIEKEFDGVERLINIHPVKATPRVKDVDVLIGFNNDELYASYAPNSEIELDLSDLVETWINANFDLKDEELLNKMKDNVRHFYFGDGQGYNEMIQEIRDIGSDFFFVYPMIRTVNKYLENGIQNMFLYMFSYDGGRNFVKHRENITGGGAAHADELGYLFDISYMEKPLTSEDQLIVDRMTELWANFIKYGNPTPNTTELVPVLWPPVTENKWYFLELDTEIHVATRPLHKRMAYLDLFFKKNQEYQHGYEGEPSNAARNMLEISMPILLAFKYFL